jgi:hypothetical protein
MQHDRRYARARTIELARGASLSLKPYDESRGSRLATQRRKAGTRIAACGFDHSVVGGIGRLGCQLAGDGDWGILSKGAPAGFGWLPSWFWAVDDPNHVLGHGVPMASAATLTVTEGAGYRAREVPCQISTRYCTGCHDRPIPSWAGSAASRVRQTDW